MRIEHGNIKYHNTGLYKSDIMEMCVVKNKGIVTLSYAKKQVALFQDLGKGYCDYEMTGLKKTDEHYGFGRPDFYIHPRGVAYCQINDKFYITDLSDKGRILMTDGHLRSVNKTYNGSRDKFFGLKSVSCNDTYVYVSVVGTGKVEVYSLDLNRNVDSFELGYRPEIISVSNSTLCVSTSENIYFYDIKTKALNIYHKMNFGTVSYISPFFFVYKNKKIYCYDEDGNLIHEIDAERLFDQYDPYDGHMGFYKDSLIISQNSEQRLIELTLDV
jgi:nitroimidazol reductase NimA-like FMN-containing flavoprotein (pyridoxamine 5'-phosphate oxidase superfamily)